jgi:hypothetical protein
LLRAPTRIELTSPRSTGAGQIEASSPSSTVADDGRGRVDPHALAQAGEMLEEGLRAIGTVLEQRFGSWR